MPSLFVGALIAACACAEPQAADGPTAQQVRRAVERALPYLEKEGVSWWQTKKCVTCHQMPMMFWSHYDAQKRGFAVNQKVLDRVRGEILDRMAGKTPGLKAVTDDNSILI